MLDSSTECPVGFYCLEGTEYSEQYPCTGGTYQPYTGQSTCVKCEPGAYCGSSKLSAVTGLCAGGYYCNSGSTVNKPLSTMENDPGARCQIGTYCPEGSTEETPCDPGSYCDARGLDAVTGTCDAGYYCELYATTATPLTDAEGGGMCPQGHFCEAGASFPKACPPGTYNN